MIYLNIISVLRRVDKANEAEYNARAKECTDAVFQYHFHPELGCTLENVAPDGTPGLEYTAGRVVNPGHDMECSLFVMEQANQTGDAALHKNAETVFRQAIEAGWDKEYGGRYGYLRRDGLPAMPSTKGSTFKGPFHLPRMLVMADRLLGELLA